MMNRLALVLTIASAVLLFGCNDSDGGLVGELGKEQQQTASLREPDESDLADMALTLGDYGSEYEVFELDDESGPQSRADQVEGDCDPEDEAKDLDRTGWLAGHARAYTPNMLGFSFSEAAAIFVGTDLDLLESANGAAEYFQDGIGETVKVVGTECQGLIIEGVDEFGVSVIGDEAWGSRIRFTYPNYEDINGVLTTVVFRRGPIIASVTIAAVNQEVDEDEVIELAHKLDARIVSVLKE